MLTQHQMVDILAVYDACDERDGLTWRVDQGEVTFLAVCSDCFWWATADVEPIAAEDIPLLQRTASELKDMDQMWLSELFAARKRGMRPMRATYKSPHMSDKLRALFDACGPERDPRSEG